MNISEKSLKQRKLILTLIGLFLILLYILFNLYRVIYYPVNFDEGSYAYKGYSFVSGEYQPFQDYGFWTNKMPLAFLVPGLFQHLASGILTGRLLAMAFGLVALAGSYCLAARLAGQKAGLVVLAVSAFSLSTITNYSMAITQSMTAALLVWAFYFVVQDKDRRWRVYLGSLLALLAVFTRQNMVFVLPVIWLYVVTQKKAGHNLLYTLVLLLAFLGLHIPFWPNIRMVWADSIPPSLHFLDTWRSPGISYLSATLPSPSLLEQLRSVAETFLTHGVSFLGGFWGLVVIFRKRKPEHYQEIALLTISFWLLVVAHGFGTIGSKAMNWGFGNLFDFFGLLGVVIFAILFAREADAALIPAILTLPAFGFSLGSYYQELLPSHWEKILLPYYSFSKAHINMLSAADLVTRLGASSTRSIEPWILPILGTFLTIIILVLWGSWILILHRRIRNAAVPLIWLTLIVSLTSQPVGWWLGLNNTRGCWPNVVLQGKTINRQLQTLINAPAVVMLTSTDDLSFLLGLKGVEVPPASINRPWGERLDAGENELLRVGLYNQGILDQWYQQADYLLLNPLYTPSLSTSVWECYQDMGMAHYEDGCGTQRTIQILRNTCK